MNYINKLKVTQNKALVKLNAYSPPDTLIKEPKFSNMETDSGKIKSEIDNPKYSHIGIILISNIEDINEGDTIYLSPFTLGTMKFNALYLDDSGTTDGLVIVDKAQILAYNGN